jgi:hypothetical protein
MDESAMMAAGSVRDTEFEEPVLLDCEQSVKINLGDERGGYEMNHGT